MVILHLALTNWFDKTALPVCQSKVPSINDSDQYGAVGEQQEIEYLAEPL